MASVSLLDLDALTFEDGMTLGDAIVAAATRRVLQDGEVVRITRERVAKISDETIRARIFPLVDRALADSLQPTNTFGEPKGEPTTLREVIVAKAEKYLREPDPEARRAGRQTPTRIESFIAKEVKAAVDEQLRALMLEAQAEISAGVKDRAAEVLSETIRRAAR